MYEFNGFMHSCSFAASASMEAADSVCAALVDSAIVAESIFVSVISVIPVVVWTA